jgi:NADH:ubiquinone oxidoreductase subunit F (NADH-binding)
MLIAGYAIGAREGYIYVRAEYPLAVERLEIALKQAKTLKLSGARILGSDFSFNIRLFQGSGAFVCGEETALIASLEGHAGMPRHRPPYPATHGLHGRPTVVNNVKTLAYVRHIINNGAEWFADIDLKAARHGVSLAGKSSIPAWWKSRWAPPCARLSSTSAAASPRARSSRPCKSAARPAAVCPNQR